MTGFGFAEKTPEIMPHNMEAEQGLLGCLLVDNRQIEEVGDDFSAEYFFFPAHKRIYEAITETFLQGRSASPVTLKAYFDGDTDLDGVGGAAYMADLAANVVSLINTADYARTIRDLALRRALIEELELARAAAFHPERERPAETLMEGLEERLFALSETGESGVAVRMIDAHHEAMALIERAQRGEQIGISTGIAALDEKIGGLEGGDLIIIAGRPSMGKTVMGQTLSYNAAQNGCGVKFFSLEMSTPQIMMRFLARATGIPTQPQRRAGGLNPENFKQITAASQIFARMNLHIDASAGLGVQAIRNRVRRHKRKHGCDLVVIDQLSHITPPERMDNPAHYLGVITRGLKAMAKDLNVPVVLLHQINRGVEARENKRPALSDLRDSGAIEQDADIVMFLYRAEYYLERDEPARGKSDTDESYNDKMFKWQDALTAAKGHAEVIVAKQRMGEPGIVKLRFSGARQVFEDGEG